MAWISDDAGAESRDNAISTLASGGTPSGNQLSLVEAAALQAGEVGDKARAALEKAKKA